MRFKFPMLIESQGCICFAESKISVVLSAWGLVMCEFSFYTPKRGMTPFSQQVCLLKLLKTTLPLGNAEGLCWVLFGTKCNFHLKSIISLINLCLSMLCLIVAMMFINMITKESPPAILGPSAAFKDFIGMKAGHSNIYRECMGP